MRNSPKRGGHLGVRLAHDVLVMAAAVVLKILDGDDGETPLLGLVEQLGGAHHRAVVAHDLAAQTALLQTGQTAQINGRLRVAVARQHAAAARDEREYVTRTAQILRPGVRVDALAAGEATFLCGNAGRGVDMVNGDREGGVVVVGVDLDHLLEAEVLWRPARSRRADEALGLRRHEVDVLSGRELRRADEVALVLAVGVVDDHDEMTGAQLLKSLLDRAVVCCHVNSSVDYRNPFSARKFVLIPPVLCGAVSFSTYFPMTSHSRFTGSPGFLPSRMVCAPVCGMMETEKSVSVTAATVKLTPSMAIEPFSTM